MSPGGSAPSGDPWAPPRESAAVARPSVGMPLGCAITLALHGLATALAFGPGGFGEVWLWGFGVLQLVYVAPLAALGIALGWGRPFVIGVFVGAAAAFALEAALWGARLGVSLA